MTSVIGNHSSAHTVAAQEVVKDRGLGLRMTLSDIFEANTGKAKFMDVPSRCSCAISVNVKTRAGSLLVRITSGSISIDAMVWGGRISKELFNG